MSNTQSPAYRSGIWEIRESTITAHLPEGDMVLAPADIDFIRLQSGFESGLSYCDAFIRAKGDSHSYPAGRSASAQDDLCKVLGQFAYWNKVELIRPTAEPSVTDRTPGAETTPLLSIPAPAKVRRASVSMPKSPDSAYQTMRAPDSASAHGTGTSSNDTTSTSGWTSAASHPEAGQQQSGFTPPPGPNGQQSGFTPPPGFNGQQPGYGPQQDFRSQMPWWQWAFHPANPNFYKTIIAVALLGSVLLAAVIFGGMRGVRMSSVSWPGIIAFIIFSKQMKRKKAERQSRKQTPPPGASWNGQPGWQEPWQGTTNWSRQGAPQQPEPPNQPGPQESTWESGNPEPDQAQGQESDEADNPYSPSDASKENRQA